MAVRSAAADDVGQQQGSHSDDSPEARPEGHQLPTHDGPSSANTPTADRGVANWPVALGVAVIGCFLSFLDVSIVNVGLAAMQNDFGATTGDIEWVSTVYSLTIGVVIPASGWLGERYGLARVYLWSMAAFAIASLLCGTAWDLPSMITFRILQAVPGAVLPTVTLVLTHRIVPKHQIGIGMAIYGISGVFAPAIGPTLGGYLIELESWRWTFLVNLPICAISVTLTSLYLPKFASTNPPRFDWWGFATIGPGLFALLLALSKGSDWGWGGYRVLGLLTAAALLLAAFIIVELEVEHPLFDPRLFRIPIFSNCQILVAVLSSGYFAVLFYFPLFMQHGQRITPIHTGLAMLPEALAMGIGAPLGGMLYDKIGARWPTFAGLIVAAFGSWLMCQTSWDLSRTTIMAWTAIRGFGYSLAIIPVMTAGLAAVPPERADGANAFSNLVYRVAAALVLAALNAFAVSHQAQLAHDWGPQDTSQPAGDLIGLSRMYQHFQLIVQARVIGDIFYILTLVTLVTGILASMLSTGRPVALEDSSDVRGDHTSTR